MMNATKITILASFVLILSLPAWGATKYGDASINKGKVIVLRAGKRLTFDSNDRNVQINHQDVVRLGQDSSMVLSTVEKATITLGSNAVLHVKSWQRREQKGFFRMLFGRMRAKISGLVGSERFNVRSATATIGVKGTEETLLTNVQGDCVVAVSESVVQLGGLDGKVLDVPEGAASAVVGGITPQVTFTVDPATVANLDSDKPTADVSMQVPLGQTLVDNGVVTQEQIDRSETGASEGVELPEAAPPGEEQQEEKAEEAEDVVDDAGEKAAEAATERIFTAPVSIDFEN
ncbi:MAG: FecR domain-containing protein [SAR324 cluster bacterium]|nr:FecR domain-containing protein [SAR324 cluster bacterium]